MFHWITQVAGRELAELRRQAAIRELERLDDRLLGDIGLRREELFLLGRARPGDHRPRRMPAPVLRLGMEPCG